MIKLITCTPDAEKLLVYMARVSSPNQENTEFAGLLKYLISHKHYSPFELVHMVVEIETSRAVAAQILRHRSFSFQEFSQRYSAVTELPPYSIGRRQSVKNRQSSVDELGPIAQGTWFQIQEETYQTGMANYQRALDIGVSREQARLLLPLATPTRLYMSGSLRSWIHYLELRTGTDTQKEHRDIADAIKAVFVQEFPHVAEALGWTTN